MHTFGASLHMDVTIRCNVREYAQPVVQEVCRLYHPTVNSSKFVSLSSEKRDGREKRRRSTVDGVKGRK